MPRPMTRTEKIPAELKADLWAAGLDRYEQLLEGVDACFSLQGEEVTTLSRWRLTRLLNGDRATPEEVAEIEAIHNRAVLQPRVAIRNLNRKLAEIATDKKAKGVLLSIEDAKALQMRLMLLCPDALT